MDSVGGHAMKFLFLSICFFAFSCSSFNSRKLASTSAYYKTYQHSYRFYTITKFLPKSYKVYQRTRGGANLKIEFTTTAKPGEFSCEHLWEKQGQKHKDLFDPSAQNSLDVDMWTESLSCQYKGEERYRDLNIAYNYKWYEFDKWATLPKDEDKIKKQIDELEKNEQKFLSGENPTIAGIEGSMASKEYILDAGQSEVKLDVKNGQRIKISQISGEILFKWGRYQKKISPIGLSSVSSQYIAPTINKMAFVCGMENGENFNLLLSGKEDKEFNIKQTGTLVCTVNHKKGYSLTLNGSFRFTLSQADKESILKGAQAKKELLQGQLSQVQDKIQKEKLEKTQYYEKFLLQDINPLIKAEKENKDLEPPVYCSQEVESSFMDFNVTKRQALYKTGEFCTTPVEYEGLYYSACDSRNDPNYFGQGRILVFDGKNRRININTIKPVEGFEESINASKDIVKQVVDGEFIQMAISTYDGRVLFLDKKGNTKNTLKLERSFLYNLMLLENGMLALVGKDGQWSRSGTLYVIDQQGNIHVQKEEKKFALVSTYKAIGNQIVLGNARGDLEIYSSELELLKKVKVEEGSYIGDITIYEGKWYFGSEKGNLYEYDPDQVELKKLASVPNSGNATYSVTNKKYIADSRGISDAPVFFQDGSVALFTYDDSRVHYLTRDFKYRFAVKSKKVSRNFKFGKIIMPSGQEAIMATTISYLNVFDKDGHFIGQGSNSGAENMQLPLKVDENQYLVGMYNGVFFFAFKESDKTSKITQKWACDQKQ